MSETIRLPEHLLNDRYWRGTLYLFINNSKLKQYFIPTFFDLEEGIVEAEKLKKKSNPWSQSEKFMLRLALHLFNERHAVNLSDMDYLDTRNKALAMEAIRLRFG